MGHSGNPARWCDAALLSGDGIAVCGFNPRVFQTGAKPFKSKFSKMIRILILSFGIIAILLGGLWLLQGLGLVNIRPILCFADCAPVQGPSTTWAVVGAFALAAGGICIGRSRRQLPK